MAIIDSRKIEDLHPYMQSLCREHIKRAEEKIPRAKVITTSTLRNQERQDQLWTYGRTDKSKPIVTKARRVKAHGFGLGYDLCIVIDNKAVYQQKDLPKDYPMTCKQIWDIVGQIGEELGLEWAYRWKDFPETCHFQILEGITTDQLHNGKRPSIWNKQPINFDKPKQSTLEILQSKGIIHQIVDWTIWLKRETIEPEYAHALIKNFYRYKSGKDDLNEAIDFLQKNHIISDVDYWKNKEPKECKYVKIIMDKMTEL